MKGIFIHERVALSKYNPLISYKVTKFIVQKKLQLQYFFCQYFFEEFS